MKLTFDKFKEKIAATFPGIEFKFQNNINNEDVYYYWGESVNLKLIKIQAGCPREHEGKEVSLKDPVFDFFIELDKEFSTTTKLGDIRSFTDSVTPHIIKIFAEDIDMINSKGR